MRPASPPGQRGKTISSRQHRIKVLYRISDLINSTTNSNTLLRRILRETVEVMGATSGTIAFVDDNTQVLKIVEAQGLDTRAARAMMLKVGEGVTGRVAQTGKVLRVNDVKTSQWYVELKKGIKSELAAPLRMEGRVIGVLNVDSARANSYTEDDEKLLSAIASQAARIIHTSRLYDRLAEQTHRLETLFELGQSLITPDPLEQILNRITAALLKLIDVHQCTVLMVAEKSDLALKASGEGFGHYVQRKAGGDAGAQPDSLVGSRGHIKVLEVRKPEGRRAGKLPKRSKPATLMSVPIFFQDTLVAILNIYTAKPREFDPSEMRLLNAFASICGIAIQNARQYERVIQAEAEIRQTDRLSTMGALSNEVAREIRNPMTVITLLLHSLREDGAISPGRGKDMVLIQEKLDRINTVLSQVLSFSQKRAPRLEWVDVNAAAEEVIFLVQHTLSARQIMIRRKLLLGVPKVLADKAHVEQVLLHLVINAMEAMRNGGILTVQTSASAGSAEDQSEPSVRVTVRDTGPGIDPAIADQIFELFTTGREQGLGLGLFVSQKILEQYGGRISVRSALGNGASFSMILPVPADKFKW